MVMKFLHIKFAVIITLSSTLTFSKDFFKYLETPSLHEFSQKKDFDLDPAPELKHLIMAPGPREKMWDNGLGPLIHPIFQKHLDVITQSTLIEGNQAQLLVSGMMSYKVRYTLIDNAKHSIVMSALGISAGGGQFGPMKDESVKIIAHKLKNAIKRNVEVFIIYDGITGSFNGTQKFVNDLRKSGANVIKYNPLFGQYLDLKFVYPLNLIHFAYNLFKKTFKDGPDLFRNRWHHKTLIVDGTYAVTGGLNIGDEYADGNLFIENDYQYKNFLQKPLIKEIGLSHFFPLKNGWGHLTKKGWRDNDVLLKGPVVHKIQERCLKDYFILKELMKRDSPFMKWKMVTEDILKQVDDIFDKKYRANPSFFPIPEFYTQGLIIRSLSQRPFINLERKLYQDMIPTYAKENNLYYLKERPQAVITHYFVNMIDKAQTQILWGGFSLGPKKDIFMALMRAAQRGVKIYLITNSKKASRQLDDLGITTYYRNKRIYGPLISAGIPDSEKGKKQPQSNIRIFEWQRQVLKNKIKIKSGAFHSKNMSIDGIFTFIGSYNMTGSSYINFVEGGVGIYNLSFNKTQQEMFVNDLKYTKEVKLEFD